MTSKTILDILKAVADYDGTIKTVTAYLSVVKKAPLWKHVDVTKAPHPNKTLTYTWKGPAAITVGQMYDSVKAGVKKTTEVRNAGRKAAAPPPPLEDLTGPYAELLQGKASITEKTIALAMSGEKLSGAQMSKVLTDATGGTVTPGSTSSVMSVLSTVPLYTDNAGITKGPPPQQPLMYQWTGGEDVTHVTMLTAFRAQTAARAKQRRTPQGKDEADPADETTEAATADEEKADTGSDLIRAADALLKTPSGAPLSIADLLSQFEINVTLRFNLRKE